MKCKECGYEVSSDATFCGKCGKQTLQGSDKVKCKKCDCEIDSNLEYCPKCGEPIYRHGNDRKRNRRKDDDDDEEGGILDSIGSIVGKLFGG